MPPWLNTRSRVENFDLFPKLPIESRLKIWYEFIHEPCIVEVLWSESRGYHTDRTMPLQVCAESRQHALKSYTLIEVENEKRENNEQGNRGVGESRKFAKAQHKTLFGVYVDLSRDTLYLSMADGNCMGRYEHTVTRFLQSLAPNIATQLRNLAWPADHFSTIMDKKDENGNYSITKFQALRTLYFVLSNQCLSWRQGVVRSIAPHRAIVGSSKIDLKGVVLRELWDDALGRVLVEPALPGYKRFPDNIQARKGKMVKNGVDEGFLQELGISLVEISR